MCGIIGYASKKTIDQVDWLTTARDKMAYRGPDHAGLYQSACSRVAFGQRRLAIISITEDSNQPMKTTINGDEYIITFNGEIYNYKELRAQLILFGYSFQTASDTEVILAAYAQWREACVQKFEGMFSFVIHDIKNQKLFFARDIVGEKPFYYYHANGSFYFSSEFLPLVSHPTFNGVISLRKIIQYFELGYLPLDASFSDQIKKLPAGHFGIFDLATGNIQIAPFFKLSANKPLIEDFDACLKRFDNLLEHSVSDQLRSDVSIGVLLSGGVDSSIVTCKANAINTNIVNYTVDFGNNEAELNNAKLISQKYGCKHQILDFGELNPSLFNNIIAQMDEPVGDSSFVPTFLITKMIRELDGKVVLGGDGADELFGGYSLYQNWQKVHKRLLQLPQRVLSTVARTIDKPYKFNSFKAKKWAVSAFPVKTNKVPNIRYVFSRNELAELLNRSARENYADYYQSQFDASASLYHNLSFFDLFHYFGSNILLKNDRASMLNSIELRAPFLNKEIVDFAFTEVPEDFKIKNGTTKYFLKEYGKSIFPSNYNFHPKRGFNFSDNLLLDDTWYQYFRKEIFSHLPQPFNKQYIEYLLKSAREGAQNNFVKLYSILVLFKWIAENNLSVNYSNG